MSKIRILDFNYGKELEYEQYKSGSSPSHSFYGMIEIEKKGYEVKHVSMSRLSGLKGIIENTLLIINSKCNVLFCSYIYIMPLLGIAILKNIGLCRKLRIIGVSHTSFHDDYSFFKRLFCKFVYRIFDRIFFHSLKNMEEGVATGFLKSDRLKLLHWGIDLKYLDEIISSTENKADYFISTGREYRDFPILISAFSQTNINLRIYTNKTNYENNYEFLSNFENKYSNIEIKFVTKSKETSLHLANLTAQSFCVVIPLQKEASYYCLGHTSIVEALAMGKPIIVSSNDYHPIDVEKEHVGIKINSSDPSEWIKAITYLSEHKEEAKLMGKNGKRLAREKYNIEICADEILDSIKALF